MTVLHKGNYKDKVIIYAGWGQYTTVPKPMCNNKVSPWSKKKDYTMVRNWKYVTCKLCLKKAPK